ncbi:IclR family transcriptional regulator [Virgibacillus ainsalahensis]
MAEPKKGAQIQSLLVGFTIIDLLSKHTKPLKFNEIHHETNITKSNLYKYLNTLTSLGAVYRNKETGAYSLGTTLIQYGMSALNKENIMDKVNPFLEEINLKLEETTLLTTWTNEGPMIAQMIHSSSGLNLGGQVGSMLPIHSAGGKLFAAFQTGLISDIWKEKEYNKMSTEQVKELENELDEIRSQKIAFATGALATFVSSIAIPIFNYADNIVGSIVIVGFEKTIPSDKTDERSEYLRIKGKEISGEMGLVES